MIALIFAILTSSFIFVLFKLFPKYSVNTFQAIVFNYVTACICGFSLFGDQWKMSFIEVGHWPYFAILCGFLFIGLFYLIGISSQKNGVAITSVAVKMSMALSMLLIIFLYRESVSFLKIVGIIAAFTGVFLMAFQKEVKSNAKSYIWMLVVLFLGCAILDFILNYVQKYELSQLPCSLFSAIGFGVSGVIGLIILMVQFIRYSVKIEFKNIIAGILLGIPNFFSIYLLLESYSSTSWNDSTVLAIMNVSVVMISALIGFSAFKESASKQKIAGLVISILAIVILYIASNS